MPVSRVPVWCAVHSSSPLLFPLSGPGYAGPLEEHCEDDHGGDREGCGEGLALVPGLAAVLVQHAAPTALWAPPTAVRRVGGGGVGGRGLGVRGGVPADLS